MAPAVALPEALKRANLTVDDISRFEVNEAFSVVVRVAEKLLQLDPAKVNVDGRVLLLVSIRVAFLMSFFNSGAVALGHAIGNSGSRIVVSLVHGLKSGEYGAAGICNGVSHSSS
jgi:acetyl-CoA C-acetyltransferase